MWLGRHRAGQRGPRRQKRGRVGSEVARTGTSVGAGNGGTGGMGARELECWRRAVRVSQAGGRRWDVGASRGKLAAWSKRVSGSAGVEQQRMQVLARRGGVCGSGRHAARWSASAGARRLDLRRRERPTGDACRGRAPGRWPSRTTTCKRACADAGPAARCGMVCASLSAELAVRERAGTRTRKYR
jgi:hypothetical protein